MSKVTLENLAVDAVDDGQPDDVIRPSTPETLEALAKSDDLARRAQAFRDMAGVR